jgi:hypothetical protein
MIIYVNFRGFVAGEGSIVAGNNTKSLLFSKRGFAKMFLENVCLEE